MLANIGGTKNKEKEGICGKMDVYTKGSSLMI